MPKIPNTPQPESSEKTQGTTILTGMLRSSRHTRLLKQADHKFPDLRAIERRMKKIQVLYNNLFITVFAFLVYESTGKGDSFVKFVDELIATENPFRKTMTMKSGDEPPLIETLQSMSSAHYSAPLKPIDILNHLKALWVYWGYHFDFSGGSPEEINEEFFDLALQDLTEAALSNIATLKEKGKRDKHRHATMAKTKRGIADKKKEWVYIIYHRSSKIKVGMTFHGIAKAIHDDFDRLRTRFEIPDDMVKPGVDSIKGYLTGNPTIMKHFEKIDGRIIKKR